MNEAQIIDYYEQCHHSYRDAWGMDKNMQLNLGLWKKGTKNLAVALVNLNREIAQLGEINAKHHVLDAGCGVGGTAIFLAKNFGCQVTGISLTPSQVQMAKENAKKSGVENLLHFEEGNFMHTRFEDESFTHIIGMESICYAEPKKDFLKEAYRLLKPGGKIVLAENLQAKDELNPKEFEILYTKGFHGCQVQSLDTAKNYLNNLVEIGFKNGQCEDYTELIKPSIKRLRRFFYLAWIYNKLFQLMGKPFSKTKLANTTMCYYLQTGLDKKLWSYGLISAEK